MKHPRHVPWIASLEPATHGAFHNDSILDFSANGNVIGPAGGVAEALRSVDLSRYPDREARQLREAIAERDGVPFEGVVVGNGSTELIWAVARAYLAPGDGALVVTPAYGEYEVASRAAGAAVVYCPDPPLGQGSGGRGRGTEAGLAAVPWPPTPDPQPVSRSVLPELDLESLLAAVRRERPRVVWLSHPNNPTGLPFPVEWLPRLIEAAPECLFVVDEAYLMLAPGVESALRLIEFGHLIVLRSLTKDLGLAGLRLGYAIASQVVADALQRALPPWSVSSLAQAGGTVALADRAHLERARAAVGASRAHLTQGLASLGLRPFPSVTNFVLVPVGVASRVTRSLLEREIAVRDCTSFGLPDCIRLGVRAIADQERLLAALREVLPG